MAEQLISAGKLVALTYRIEDGQGNILEQTDIPVSYIHGGQTELIGGMGAAVDGRRAGDAVELTLGPDQGFGAHDPDLIFTDALENVPPEFRFVGAEVQMENEAGRRASSTSPESRTASSPSTVTIRSPARPCACMCGSRRCANRHMRS
jgi:FKBP-type peptidyl-prolyl cis-trans isomerase SlyD